MIWPKSSAKEKNQSKSKKTKLDSLPGPGWSQSSMPMWSANPNCREFPGPWHRALTQKKHRNKKIKKQFFLIKWQRESHREKLCLPMDSSLLINKLVDNFICPVSKGGKNYFVGGGGRFCCQLWKPAWFPPNWSSCDLSPQLSTLSWRKGSKTTPRIAKSQSTLEKKSLLAAAQGHTLTV